MGRNWILLLIKWRGVISFSKGCCYMSKSIYVGNLSWNATEEQVRALFAEYGNVISVKLVSDRDTGRARGFGFVEMEDADARAAIEALDNVSFGDRTLRVNEAKPKSDAPRRPRSY
jgi:RNA recognition motif-containing protein